MPRYKNNSTSDLPISYVLDDGLRETKYIPKGGTLDIRYYVPELLRHTLISVEDMDILPVASPVINNWTETITLLETFIDYTPDDDSLSVNRQSLLIQNDTSDTVYIWINYDFDIADPAEVTLLLEKLIPILTGDSLSVTIPSYSYLVRLELLDTGTIYLTSMV